MPGQRKLLTRSETFCDEIGIAVPILLAPMAGACPPTLSVAVANAGGMGACGALPMKPAEIAAWANDFRSSSSGCFQMNLWIRDAKPNRNEEGERQIRAFLQNWGPAVAENEGEVTLPDFDAQCEAMLAAEPTVISSIMGVYDAAFVERMKAKGVKWFATVTTVTEALQARAAGADVVVAQGHEAGGHRGAFNPGDAMRKSVGLFSLLPTIVDAVDVPVVATGGITDARGVAAALLLGASAVQLGTGFLRCPEAGIATAWRDAIGKSLPEETLVTRAFSGCAGRSIATAYAVAMEAADAPVPAPYPTQRGLTQKMRSLGTEENDIDRIQAWAGQSAILTNEASAAELTVSIWKDVKGILG